jgi:sec-independent protein translocase protein TatC
MVNLIELAVWLVLLLALLKTGVVSHHRLRLLRWLMILICLWLGALLTTPEVLTQVLMAIPLYLLYEFSLRLSRNWVAKN